MDTLHTGGCCPSLKTASTLLGPHQPRLARVAPFFSRRTSRYPHSGLFLRIVAPSGLPWSPFNLQQPFFARFVVRAQSDTQHQQKQEEEKIPFGYTRKDVIAVGIGLTALGFGIRYGLEYLLGLDAFQAGNVAQLVVVLGLCLGWVSTYLWRVGNKEMTYAKQLRDYENAVMQKRLELLSETELEAMLAEVEEEKERIKAKKGKE